MTTWTNPCLFKPKNRIVNRFDTELVFYWLPDGFRALNCNLDKASLDDEKKAVSGGGGVSHSNPARLSGQPFLFSNRRTEP